MILPFLILRAWCNAICGAGVEWADGEPIPKTLRRIQNAIKSKKVDPVRLFVPPESALWK